MSQDLRPRGEKLLCFPSTAYGLPLDFGEDITARTFTATYNGTAATVTADGAEGLLVTFTSAARGTGALLILEDSAPYLRFPVEVSESTGRDTTIAPFTVLAPDNVTITVTPGVVIGGGGGAVDSVDGQTGVVDLSGTYAQVVAGLLSIGGVALLESVFPSTLTRDTELTSAIGTEVTDRNTAITAAINAHAAAVDPHGDRAYAASLFAANDAMVYRGVIDCSANPNYPAADAGHTYRISVAGKIGGASGVVVEAGDMAICVVDGTAAGTQAAVGANWDVIQTNHGVLATVATTGASTDLTDTALLARLASPTFTGDPKAPTPAAADNDTSIATTAFVQGELTPKAPLASPTFTGDPKAPTPSAGDNDTSIATTAFVTAADTALDLLDNHIAWSPLLYVDSVVGTWSQNAGQVASAVNVAEYYNSSNALNNAITWKLPRALQAGTYTLKMQIQRHGGGAIHTLEHSIDGSSWTALTTYDSYSASNIFAVLDFTGVTIPAGTRYLRDRAASKNGSSSGYYLLLYHVEFLRTA